MSLAITVKMKESYFLSESNFTATNCQCHCTIRPEYVVLLIVFHRNRFDENVSELHRQRTDKRTATSNVLVNNFILRVCDRRELSFGETNEKKTKKILQFCLVLMDCFAVSAIALELKLEFVPVFIR